MIQIWGEFIGFSSIHQRSYGADYTLGYDVFALIDSLSDNVQAQYEQLEKLAFLIMPDMPGARDASMFFNTEGRKILTAALTAFYYSGMDFPAICRKVVSSSCADLFRDIDA